MVPSLQGSCVSSSRRKGSQHQHQHQQVITGDEGQNHRVSQDPSISGDYISTFPLHEAAAQIHRHAHPQDNTGPRRQDDNGGGDGRPSTVDEAREAS